MDWIPNTHAPIRCPTSPSDQVRQFSAETEMRHSDSKNCTRSGSTYGYDVRSRSYQALVVCKLRKTICQLVYALDSIHFSHHR